MSPGDKSSPPLPRFEVKPKACNFRKDTDVHRLNQFYNQLEVEDFQRKVTKSLAPGGGARR